MSETLRKSRDSYHCEILLGTPLEYSFCYVVSLVADSGSESDEGAQLHVCTNISY
jgi:hypothetical protein